MGGLCQITHLRYPVKPPLLFVHPDDTFDPHSTATATWFRWFFSPLLWASDLSQSRALFCFHLDRIVAASCVWTSSMHKVLLLLWACHLRRSLWLRPRERQAYQAHPLHHQCHWLPQPARSPLPPSIHSILPPSRRLSPALGLPPSLWRHSQAVNFFPISDKTGVPENSGTAPWLSSGLATAPATLLLLRVGDGYDLDPNPRVITQTPLKEEKHDFGQDV